MKVLNFGSLNVDYVYDVDHFVLPGETISAKGRSIFSGGKGLNQSVAMAKAGVDIYHAGSVGTDGAILLDTLKEAGINTDYIIKQDAPGGHTVIQVDKNGQNCIIVYGGTNRMLETDFIDKTLENFSEGDILVLQNEINNIPYIMDKAYEKGIDIVLNPSPYDEIIKTLPLEKVKYFIINEIEGARLSGRKDFDGIIPAIAKKYPNANVLLTMGELGSMYYDGKDIYKQDIFKVKAVDTTAAGDTFLGYFVYGLTAEEKMPIAAILKMAAKASSITVSNKGAAGSIPTRSEVFASM